MGVFAFFSSRRQRGGSFAAVTRVSRSGFSSYGGVDWGAAGGVASFALLAYLALLKLRKP